MIRLCIILLALGWSQAASASNRIVSLPSELKLESDERYDPYDGYAPLQPLTGSYIHGFTKGYVRFERPEIKANLRASCPEGFTFSSHPSVSRSDFEHWPDAKFWYFRYEDQALYIRLTQVGKEANGCDVVLRPETKIVRGHFFKDRVTTFNIDQIGFAKFEVVLNDGYFSTEIPNALMRDGLTPVRKASGSRKRQYFDEPMGKPLIKDHEEECYINGGGLDGGVNCYISSQGALFGLKTYSSYNYHDDRGHWDDSGSSYFAIVEANARAKMDSRLFEWDREITAAQQQTRAQEK